MQPLTRLLLHLQLALQGQHLKVILIANVSCTFGLRGRLFYYNNALKKKENDYKISKSFVYGEAIYSSNKLPSGDRYVFNQGMVKITKFSWQLGSALEVVFIMLHLHRGSFWRSCLRGRFSDYLSS